MEQDTIAAIATPMGSGGIGIIKISGKEAFKILSDIFKRSASPSSTIIRFPELSVKTPRIYHGYIIDPKSRHTVDEVLVSMMPGPKSHTREDVVEINTHSGYAVVNTVLKIVLDQGARLATPGEFTKRAFLNGRIDLTQAEAVVDIIEAKTTQAMESAAKQIKGGLGRIVNAVLCVLDDILIETEANIDFPDDIPDDFDAEKISFTLQDSVLNPLMELLKQYEVGKFFKHGIRTAIVGKPNVGKSSLMNCLLKKERAIVSAVPGTTRDFIEEESRIDRLPTVFVDTAGLHNTADEIENMGIQKTYEHIHSADLVLFVIDSSTAINDDDVEIYEKIRHKRMILVLNKMDLAGDMAIEKLPTGWPVASVVWTSALYRKGIGDLEKAILQAALGEGAGISSESTLIINMRHKEAIEKCVETVEGALFGLREGLFPELVAVDLKEAKSFLEELLGINVKEDIIEKIFNNFCIGK